MIIMISKIDNAGANSKCRLCDNRKETVNHIRENKKLALKGYKNWHIWVEKVIQWELCKKLKFPHSDKW